MVTKIFAIWLSFRILVTQTLTLEIISANDMCFTWELNM